MRKRFAEDAHESRRERPLIEDSMNGFFFINLIQGGLAAYAIGSEE